MSIVLGANLAPKIDSIKGIYGFSVAIFIANLAIYFLLSSFLFVAFGAYSIFQMPLALSNVLCAVILSMTMPKWKYGPGIEEISINSRAARMRWSILITIPITSAFCISSLAMMDLSLQLLLMVLIPLHLECIILFRKTAKSKDRISE